jgi:hypothetical protein
MLSRSGRNPAMGDASFLFPLFTPNQPAFQAVGRDDLSCFFGLTTPAQPARNTSLRRTRDFDFPILPANGSQGAVRSWDNLRVADQPFSIRIGHSLLRVYAFLRCFNLDYAALINASIPFVSFAQSAVTAPVRSHRLRSACPLPYRGMLTNH